MRITIITLFPEMFESVFSSSILKRAQSQKKIEIKIVNLRDFGIGRHKLVDDKPYGGGVGMLLRVDVLDRAIKAVKNRGKNQKVILLDPKGEKYNQGIAEKLVNATNIILICGHYEGYDERVRKLVDMEISIGDYITSGGEIPAMVVVESVARLIPGVLIKKEAVMYESFSKNSLGRRLEHPHYTRPQTYKNMTAPKELLSGNPQIVDAFRNKEADKITKKRRPEMLKRQK